jgi:hypothetical protein
MSRPAGKTLLCLAWGALLSLVGLGTVRAQMNPKASVQPIPEVSQCVGRLDPAADIGYDRVAARCPDLMRTIEQAGWAAWLPRGWQDPNNDLSAGSLTELRELVRSEGAATPKGHGPEVGQLRNVLASMGVDAGSDGAWSRFKRWVRSILESRQEPEEEGWFAKMVSHAGLTQSIIDLVVYATLGVVVVLAGIIVANELRSAGLLRSRQRTARVSAEISGSDANLAAWDDVERAPLSERPRLLLGLILRRLTEQGSLPPPRGLTVRELTRVARLSESDDRNRLSDLALTAERVRYSVQSVAEENLEQPLARGKELLDRLGPGVSR